MAPPPTHPAATLGRRKPPPSKEEDVRAYPTGTARGGAGHTRAGGPPARASAHGTALQSALPPQRKQASRAAPKLGPYVEIIREWLVADLSAPRKQRHTARRVWERLVDEYGATVAEATVRACVARLRRELESGRQVVTIPRASPGRLRRWTSARSACTGVETVLPMFVLPLALGAGHVCFAGEGQEAFLEGHTVALDRLGGVPRRIRYDNLSSAVTPARPRPRRERPLPRCARTTQLLLRARHAGRMRRAAWRARSAASAAATSCRSRAWRAWPSSTRCSRPPTAQTTRATSPAGSPPSARWRRLSGPRCGRSPPSPSRPRSRCAKADRNAQP